MLDEGQFLQFVLAAEIEVAYGRRAPLFFDGLQVARDGGETTCAELPPGVPQGQSGPRLVAFTGLLMAYFRQSKRRTTLFLEAILNQPCYPVLTVKIQNQVTAALRPAYDELVATLPAQEQLSMDESPTKQGAAKAWLWTFVDVRESNRRSECCACGDLAQLSFGTQATGSRFVETTLSVIGPAGNKTTTSSPTQPKPSKPISPAKSPLTTSPVRERL